MTLIVDREEQMAGPAPLLTYRFSFDPDPIQISTALTQANGLINIAVANAAGPNAYCNQIVIAVPVGADTASLFANPPVAGSSTTKWLTTSMRIQKGTDIGLDSVDAFATIAFECDNPADFLIDYDFAFSIAGTVNQVLGTYQIKILETSGTTSDPSTFTDKTEVLSFDKANPQFYLRNLVATQPNAPTVPTTDFLNGADIRFSWESNGSYFQLFMKDVATPVYSGSETTFLMSGGVARDTTFFLVASVTGSIGQPGQGFQPVYLYDALTVTIADPNLAPKTVAIGDNPPTGKALAVAGDIQATGHIDGVGICPPGSVIMFSGNINDPAKFSSQGTGVAGTPYQGWQVCNGANGSPDLRDKFIAGAGGQYSVGQTGGTDSVVLTNAQMPSHSHGGATGASSPPLNYPGVKYCSQGVTTGIMVNIQTADPNGNRPNWLPTTGNADIAVVAHSHSIAADGGGQSHENRPQFYALAYLMKL